MKCLALFPGMAAARPGMGSALVRDPAARAVLTRFAAASGLDVTTLVTTATEEDLFADRAWEVATVAVEVASARARLAGGQRLAGALGFSIGAYAALELAGAMSASRIVACIDVVLDASRRLVGEYGMAAVTGVARDALERHAAACGVEVAAEIAGEQALVAGPRSRVERLTAALRPVALRVTVLPVRWPLHTSIMRPVADRLRAALACGGGLHAPSLPVYSTVHGRALNGAAEVADLLVEQLCSRLRFDLAARAAAREGFTQFVDVGPGQTLARAVRWVLRDVAPGPPLAAPGEPDRLGASC